MTDKAPVCVVEKPSRYDINVDFAHGDAYLDISELLEGEWVKWKDIAHLFTTPNTANGWEPITDDHAHRMRKHQGVPLLPDGCLVVMRSVNDADGECVGHEIFKLPFPAERPESHK